MVPSRSMAPGSVIPSPVHPPVSDCERRQAQGYTPTTVGKEVLGLRGAGRLIWVSEVICPPDKFSVRGANIISGKIAVDEDCHMRVS